VRFGGSDNKINLTINSAIGGQIPLKFGGRQTDHHTLSFSVEEPSGQNVISLPDVTGTVITTGNFPDTVDDLRVLGNMAFFGKVSMIGRKISIGHDELKTKLTVNSIISGRFPLSFGHVSDANVINESFASTTTFEIAPPSGDNVISFPDTSGFLLLLYFYIWLSHHLLSCFVAINIHILDLSSAESLCSHVFLAFFVFVKKYQTKVSVD
jgi:hypothetical protein